MSADDRYQRAAAASGIGIWDWNLATGEIYVDPLLKDCSATRTTRSATTWTTGAGTSIRTTPPGSWSVAQAHINGEMPAYEVEHRMVHRDGSIRWFIARGQVVRDGNGTAVGMAGTDTDITARKRSEEALRQAEELNRRIVESSGDCVKILDLDGRLLYMNPEGVRALEMADAGELLQRSLAGFFDGEMRKAADAAISVAREGGRGRFQYLMPTATGVPKWWDAVLTPITDGSGTVVQLLAVSRDITERRREEAFRAAQHQVLEMIATGSPLPVGARQRGPAGREARPPACNAPS